MSSLATVTRIADEVLRRSLPPGSLRSVDAHELVDSAGENALRVLAIVSDEVLAREDAVQQWRDAGLDLQRRLGDEGEPRFAYLRMLTEEEARAAPEDDAA